MVNMEYNNICGKVRFGWSSVDEILGVACSEAGALKNQFMKFDCKWAIFEFKIKTSDSRHSIEKPTSSFIKKKRRKIRSIWMPRSYPSYILIQLPSFLLVARTCLKRSSSVNFSDV